MKSDKRLITEDVLIKAGFKNFVGNTYRLKISLPYPGERFIEADAIKILTEMYSFSE